ncbi:MAG: hypothetical protein GY953_09475, partial [bacterium]|nr:hypothetical protein [bacterium]
SEGAEVAYVDDHRFHPDPVAYYEIPSSGEYTLEIKDAIYRGREDFVYRIAAGELPYITGIFPLGGRAGATTTVAVTGWNLPAAAARQQVRPKSAGYHRLAVRNGEWISNRALFAADILPDRLEDPELVTLPAVVNGRIDRPGDEAVFRIDGSSGERIVAEVFARRLDSPLDSILELTGPNGEQIAANDDHEDPGRGLVTHHADSRLAVTLPAAGTYSLSLRDAQRKGGSEYAYRLRLSHPRPDFELRVVPSTVNVRAGSPTPITVHALRRDGFAGDIALNLGAAPPGFTLSGAWIPAGQDNVRLTLGAPPGRIDHPFVLHLEGSAVIGNREIRRPAIPADDMMQAFAYRHLVPAQQWMIRVLPSPRKRAAWTLTSAQPVKLPTAGTAPVHFHAPLGRFAASVQLELNTPPDGITIEKASCKPQGIDIVLKADPTKATPGLKGNLIVNAFYEQTRNKQKRRRPLGTLPAIPFEIVPPTK